MTMLRRTFLTGGASVAALVSLARGARAQPFAGKQIRLIVPFPAGGPTDIVARPLAQSLGEVLKATIVIDNRGGAGGSIGADAVAKSAPDGATLLMATVGTHAINASLYKKLAYDPVADFTPIALVAAAPVALVVHPAQPVNNLAELVALAKRSPGKLTYGSAGNGTPGQRAVVRAAQRADHRRIRIQGLRDDRMVGRVRARPIAGRSGKFAGR